MTIIRYLCSACRCTFTRPASRGPATDCPRCGVGDITDLGDTDNEHDWFE